MRPLPPAFPAALVVFACLVHVVLTARWAVAAGTAPSVEAAPPGPAATATPRLPDGCCDHCGSRAGVRRGCVAKPVVREVKKVCWDAKCVPHCIPGKSVWCGTCRGRDECGCHEYDVWRPTCARVATKVEPVKREVTRKVPGFEWTVEERCAACRKRSASEPDRR